MSIKTDRPQVKTPSQLEQKYNFAKMAEGIADLEDLQKQFASSFGDYKTDVQNKFDAIDGYLDDMQDSITTDSITSDEGNFGELKVNNKSILAPYELFYDANGSNGSITLSDSSANYECLEIFYFYNTNNSYLSSKIYNPNGKNFQLNGNYDNGTRYYMATSVYSISGASITRNEEIRWRIGTGGESNTRTDTTLSDNNIYIERVIGYK